MDIKKPVTRVLSQTEAKYLFDRFEETHCYKLKEGTSEVIQQCPGWDWNLEHLDENNQRVAGGCRYKNTHKLCTNLQLAAEGHFVLEIRPRNEEDLKKEREYEKTLLEKELRLKRDLRNKIDEEILSYENKIRNL